MAYNSDEEGRRNQNRSWWQQRTNMEQCGIIFLIITVILIIGFIAVLAIVLPDKARKDKRDDSNEDENIYILKPEEKDTVCETRGCVYSASKLLEYIDQSKDPCEDFYEFACGSFLKKTIIPDYKSQESSFTQVLDFVRKQMKVIIEEPRQKLEPKPFALLKKLYSICMNTTAIEAEGLTVVKEIVKDLGGIPVVEGKKWNANDFDWKQLVYKFRKHGLPTDSFISFDVLRDEKKSSRHLIYLDQPSLEYPIERNQWMQGFNDSMVQAYYHYMIDLAVLLGADRDFAKYEIKTMMTFKTQLANITLPEEERRNNTALYNPMTIAQLQNSYRSIPWLEYIRNVLVLSPEKITNSTVVIVVAPKYIHALEKILRTSSRRDQANHAIFQALRSIETQLPEEFRIPQQQFSAALFGTSTRISKWKECVAVSSRLSQAAGSLYARKYFNKDTKKSATEMVSDIQSEFIKMLKKVDWMDSETKAKAVEKAQSMTAHIGFADELLDDKKIEAYYADLKIHNDSYVLFMNKLSVFETNKQFKKLWDPVSKTDWREQHPPYTVDAFYSGENNAIAFSAGILQGPFFSKDRLHAMNYGAIGWIIGHEITHGFDDRGKQYDKDGNLVNWWAQKTDDAFSNKARCIIKQYADHTVPEIGEKLNGVNTQGENIADNGGIRVAYLAYKSWMERNKPEQKLPGLNYTAEQIFWISAANIWCTKDRNESLRQSILTNSHVPARYRVLVPFSNSEFFAKDFDCPKGSKMNPRHKCGVW